MFFFFFKIFLGIHMKPTSVGQLIACYEHINYLLTFSDVFLQGFTVFAGGRDSSIGPYGVGWGGIAQLIQLFYQLARVNQQKSKIFLFCCSWTQFFFEPLCLLLRLRPERYGKSTSSVLLLSLYRAALS